MKMRRCSWRAGRALGALVMIALVTCALSSVDIGEAATWCVPSASIRSSCPRVAATIQAAINAANVGDMIYVGPGNGPERVTLTKRVRLVGLPGHLITDEGLSPSSGPLIGFSGTITSPILEKLRLAVTASAAGVAVPATVSSVRLDRLVVTSEARPRPQYGIRVDGAPRPYVIGQGSHVSGFDVGIGFYGVQWLDVEPVVIERNGVGVQVVHGKGQIFWNTIRDNEIGIEIGASYQVDTNSNDLSDNGVGIVWGLAGTPNPETGLITNKQMEINHNVIEGSAQAIQVEMAPGAFSDSPLDDPGCSTQWRNNEVDGTPLVSVTTKPC